MKKQKFAIYTKRFVGHTVYHIYDTITEAIAVCNALNRSNRIGSPVYRVKPIIVFEEC